MRPRRVTIGIGPRWLRWETAIRGVPVSIGAFPYLGVADFDEDNSRTHTLSSIAVSLAAPVTNIAIGAAIIILANGHDPASRHSLALDLLRAPLYIASHFAESITNPGALPHAAEHFVSAVAFINILAIVSLAIGLLNLAPFWPLDGGQVVMAIADAIGISSNIARASMIIVGLAGTAALILPTAVLVQWPPLVGSAALGVVLGLALRLGVAILRRTSAGAPRQSPDSGGAAGARRP